VIDCAGLGARTLAADATIAPLYGQIVIAAPGAADLGVTITDDREADVFYIIPRRDEVVLGGCALAEIPATTPDPAITARILAHAARLGIAVGPVLRERTGLRPFRPTVRLERDPASPRVLHNYGHGGAGFTLSRGCAEELAGLLE
jgi:D-amino-acid oxidase